MTKPFYLTSEWWISVAAILTAVTGALPVGSKWNAIGAFAVVVAYAISRGLSKSGGKVTGTHPLDAYPVHTLHVEDHVDVPPQQNFGGPVEAGQEFPGPGQGA